ncbi:Hypothetical protein NCS54_00924300 [Fusarium falciforme]|uniref:Hypothetical protein n=1 Tax=Fusarium falciforme TaxID=195108 RepID=UPI00230070A6|nr:Hypothetical protein NCS54_00924300 [Fusarium falciforme]WAO91761.1 Hypothetical protein NCS54_00924300 [Fusarium falciforme]
MGEPLSIVSGNAGIISHGTTACSGLHTYFSALKDQGKNIEYACHHLSLLNSYIELIRPSAPTLSSRHAEAGDLIARTLIICEGELEALEKTIDKLKSGKDQLFKATAVLETVVQALILRENISISNDIEALRNAVQDNHVVTQDFLRRIETGVDTAGYAVKLESALLMEIFTAIEQQRAMTSSSHALIQSTNAMLSVKLDSVVRALILHMDLVGWSLPPHKSTGSNERTIDGTERLEPVVIPLSRCATDDRHS